MIKQTVNASKKYDVIISDGKKDFKAFLPLFDGKNILILTDDNVFNLYKDYFDGVFMDKNVYYYVIPHGEESKNLTEYAKIAEFLAKNNFTRRDSLIAFGGGVTGDLGGFSAATYLRGINFFTVPTTLLSAVDSSVGGKTAVNISIGKNLCGAFYQPTAVYIDISLLKNLPEREVKSGLGEILKYKFIAKSPENFSYEKIFAVKTAVSGKSGSGSFAYNERELLTRIISDAISEKTAVVEADERESGVRKILNFGHTVGHAIERLSDFIFSHGEAVAKGILYSLEISKILSDNKKKFDNEILLYKKALKELKICFSDGFTPKEIIAAVKSDKKMNEGGVDFVIINDDFKPEIKTIPLTELENYIGLIKETRYED